MLADVVREQGAIAKSGKSVVQGFVRGVAQLGLQRALSAVGLLAQIARQQAGEE